MRSRVLEITAALIGVAIVAFLYLDRSADSPTPAQVPAETVVLPSRSDPSETLPRQPHAAPTASEPMVSGQSSAADPDPAPEAESVEVAEALASWEAARVALDAVETELESLDQRFDAKEAELAELEAQGLDPDALEEEMLIFLDGIVEEYDQLETRLAEMEAAELAAAERLAKLRGELPDPGDL